MFLFAEEVGTPMMSFVVVLVAAALIGSFLAAVVAGLVLKMRKSGSAANSSELAFLRQELARLTRENERLREEVEQLKSGPKAAGSTDIMER
jgi:cell division protein FtsB